MSLFDLLWVWFKVRFPSEEEKEIIDHMQLNPVLFFLCKRKRVALKKSHWMFIRES